MEATGCLGSAGRDFIKIKVRRYNEDENTGTWPLLKLTENSPDKFHHFGLRLLIYRGKLTPMRGELSKTRTGTVLPNDLPDKPNRRRLSRWTISDRILSLFSLEICNKQHFRAPRSVVFRFVKLSILISVPLPRLNKEECCIRLRNQHSCTHTHTHAHKHAHTHHISHLPYNTKTNCCDGLHWYTKKQGALHEPSLLVLHTLLIKVSLLVNLSFQLSTV